MGTITTEAATTAKVIEDLEMATLTTEV